MHHQFLQSLFDEHSAALLLYARQWCDWPEDAVQEAFIALSQCDPLPTSPRGWLYVTTRRKAQNILRSEQTRRRIHSDAAADVSSHQQRREQDATCWFISDPHCELASEEVEKCLRIMHPEQRDILVARVWGELSYEELAALHECSVSSAHRRFNAAIQRLKSLLISTSTPESASTSTKDEETLS